MSELPDYGPPDDHARRILELCGYVTPAPIVVSSENPFTEHEDDEVSIRQSDDSPDDVGERRKASPASCGEASAPNVQSSGNLFTEHEGDIDAAIMTPTNDEEDRGNGSPAVQSSGNRFTEHEGDHDASDIDSDDIPIHPSDCSSTDDEEQKDGDVNSDDISVHPRDCSSKDQKENGGSGNQYRENEPSQARECSGPPQPEVPSLKHENDTTLPNIQWGQYVPKSKIKPFFPLDAQTHFHSLSDYLLTFFPGTVYEFDAQKKQINDIQADRGAVCQFTVDKRTNKAGNRGFKSYWVFIKFTKSEEADHVLKPGDRVNLRSQEGKKSPDLSGFVARRPAWGQAQYHTCLYVTERPGCVYPKAFQQRWHECDPQRGDIQLPFLTLQDPEIVPKRITAALKRISEEPWTGIWRRILLGMDLDVGDRVPADQSGYVRDLFKGISDNDWKEILKDEKFSHVDVMRFLRKIPNGIAVVYGAPGTGKTYLLWLIMQALHKLSRRLAIATPSHWAADSATTLIKRLAIISGMNLKICRYTGQSNDYDESPADDDAHQELLAALDDTLRAEGRFRSEKVKHDDLGEYSLSRWMVRDAGLDLPRGDPKAPPEWEELRSMILDPQDLSGKDERKAFFKKRNAEITKLRKTTLASFDVVIGTCASFGDKEIQKDFLPSIVAIDDAGQGSEGETLIPLSLWGGSEVNHVLIGDPYQLQPTVLSLSKLLKDDNDDILDDEDEEDTDPTRGLSEQRKKKNRYALKYLAPPKRHPKLVNHVAKQFQMSLHERLLRCGITCRHLTTQYRSMEGLFDVSNAVLYQSRITTDPQATDPNSPERQVAREFHRFLTRKYAIRTGYQVVFKSVDGAAENVKGSSSKINKANAGHTLAFLKALYEFNPTVFTADKIIILTPYQAQRSLYLQRLQELAADGEEWAKAFTDKANPLRVQTFDSSPGVEIEVALVDFVDTRIEGQPGANRFVQDYHRVNVAITRARDGMMVIGDPTLSPHYRKKSNSKPTGVSSLYWEVWENGFRNGYHKTVKADANIVLGTPKSEAPAYAGFETWLREVSREVTG